MTYNKYGAKPVYYDPSKDTAYDSIAITTAEWRKNGGMYFPSTLEYEVYRGIRSFFNKYKIPFKIAVQHTIELLPQEKEIRAITWCVDFKIEYKIDNLEPIPHTLYVEAKGIELDDYKLKKNLLERFHPSIADRLRVIRKAKDTHRILLNTMQHLHR